MGFFDDLKTLFTDETKEDTEEVEVEKINDEDNSGGGKNLFQFLNGFWMGVIVVVLVLMYLATGIYKVGPREVGVVKRFGAYVKRVDAGLHYHLPYPIATVKTPNVTTVRRIEIGFRTIDPGPPAKYKQINRESLMLTGDLAIVSANAVVKYEVANPIDYLFQIKNPNDTVRDASEAALRQIVAQNTINEVLTTKKTEIQLEAKQLLQNLLDRYQAGVHVVNFLLQDVKVPKPVKPAYRDVASAKEDKHKLINQAQAYRNKILPRAKGKAAEIINQAEAYKQKRIAEASGDIARFNQLLKKYKSGKKVTRTRLYLETMTEVLPETNKVIVGTQSQGVLKMLNLGKYREGGNE